MPSLNPEPWLRLAAATRAFAEDREEPALREGVASAARAMLASTCEITLSPEVAPVADGHSLVTPLCVVTRTYGALTFVRLDGHAPVFDASEHEVAEAIAHQVALAVAYVRADVASPALAAAERKYNTLFNSGLVGIRVSDASGEVYETNDAFLHMLGYSRREFAERGLDWHALTPREWRDADLEVGVELRTFGHCRPYEKEYFHQNGTRIPVLVGVAMLDELRAISVCVDLTDRKRAAAAMHAEQNRHQALLENSADGVTLHTPDGRFAYVSPATERILGRASGELLGRAVVEVLPPEDIDSAKESMRRLRSLPGSVETSVLRIARPDGTIRWIEMTRSNRVEDPTVRGIVCNIRDVTERTHAQEALVAAENEKSELEEQLRHAQKMEAVGRLAGGIAHDFNNVLAVIMSYADFLLTGLAAHPEMRADVDEIVKAGNRAGALTKQLLLFSRQQVLAPTVIDLNQLLSDNENILSRAVGEDVEIVWSKAPGLRGVLADPTAVLQVVMNLVVNARDALPNGGRLAVETKMAGASVVLTVADNGVGMTKETQSRIFEPFFTTKAIGLGTGLGLSTVFGIVKQCHGTVDVESEVGRGTTFKISLPATDASVSREARAPSSSLRVCSETILLVEDQAEVRKVAHAILKRNGYDVIEASCPSEAIRIVESHVGTIHLLLSDVVMPEMSGGKLAAKLLVLRPSLKVLCMSGYTDESCVTGGLLDGRFPFLEKPFTPRRLALKLREVLDSPGA